MHTIRISLEGGGGRSLVLRDIWLVLKRPESRPSRGGLLTLGKPLSKIDDLGVGGQLGGPLKNPEGNRVILNRLLDNEGRENRQREEGLIVQPGLAGQSRA